MEFVRDIAAIRLTDEVEAGGKGANLGELTAAGLPVPGGFVVLRSAYLDAMRRGGVADELAAEHRSALAALGTADELGRRCERLRALVVKAGMPEKLETEIVRAYEKLGTGSANAVVAVRSSATGEDSASASFAGIARAFAPRPVIYRATDLRSNEFRGLRGGEHYERRGAECTISGARIRSEILADFGYPQLIVRMGWAATSADQVPATP